MQKKSTLLLALSCALVLSVVTVAIAGAVYGRSTQTITSTGLWTNTLNYAALKLVRVWIEDNTMAAGTVTVTRVDSSGVYTQTCASVTCSSGDGNSATFTAGYMKYGDMLLFTEGSGSNATAIIEYEVQQH